MWFFLIHCVNVSICLLLKRYLYIQDLQTHPTATFWSKGNLANGPYLYSSQKNIKRGDSCRISSFQKNLCRFFNVATEALPPGPCPVVVTQLTVSCFKQMKNFCGCCSEMTILTYARQRFSV